MIEAAQNRVENENFEIREHLLEYDDVINAQRLAIYEQRDRILCKARPERRPGRDAGSRAGYSDWSSCRRKDPQSWQFIDWVGRLQPSLERPDGSLYPSWPLQVVSGRRWRICRDRTNLPRVRAILLALAGQALEAERRFILEQAERLCETALEEMRKRLAAAWRP